MDFISVAKVSLLDKALLSQASFSSYPTNRNNNSNHPAEEPVSPPESPPPDFDELDLGEFDSY